MTHLQKGISMASLTNINQLKMHYAFTEKDSDNLRQLRSIMEPFADEMTDKFYSYVLEIKETAQYLNTDEIITRHKRLLSGWFLNLFNGIYDNRYLARLQRVGYAHVKIKLNGHYVNSSMHLVRQFCLDILEKNIEDQKERSAYKESLHKILDLNLDVITSAYRERELSNYFLSYKLESRLIKMADRFGYGMNLVLVLALIGISVAIVGQLGLDIWSMLNGQIEQGVIHILGTLLMLWVMIELIYTEIHSLRFGRFSITVFIKVVMVAVIRDLLVGTLEQQGDWQRQAVMVGSVLVLGVVYWIMIKAEAKEAGKSLKQ
jgi:uncharacterized membrane protein (DUF373 family)